LSQAAEAQHRLAAAQAENEQLRDQVVDLQTSLDSMKLRVEADVVKSRTYLKVAHAFSNRPLVSSCCLAFTASSYLPD
jgi:hypothetical protein